MHVNIWSLSFNGLRHTVSPLQSQRESALNSSIPLLRDCRVSNPHVFLVEPYSQVSERTGTNIFQGVPSKVTPFSEQQITSLTGCYKAPNSDVIPGTKTGLNSTFCSEIYPTLILSVLRAVRCHHIYIPTTALSN